MENVIRELECKKVIDKRDILILKKHIEKKYRHNSNLEKADILAKAVHDVIDRCIEGLDKECSEKLKEELLRDNLLGNSQKISFADIFKNYIELKEDSEEFLERLTYWTNLHIKNKISKEELQVFYVKGLQSQLAIEGENSPEVQYAIYQSNIALANRSVDVNNNFINIKLALLTMCFLMLSALAMLNIYNTDNTKTNIKPETKKVETYKETKSDLWKQSNLPEDFKYKEINKEVLKKFLVSKESVLAEELYFSKIIEVAKRYNLNPIVLFAISGQEQNFVPRGDKDSKIIANNPFNVYRSWKEYNTNIEDSTKIACVTIINLCKDRPNDIEAFFWINKKYSEDKNWYKGVRQIYNKLMEEQGPYLK